MSVAVQTGSDDASLHVDVGVQTSEIDIEECKQYKVMEQHLEILESKPCN